MLNVPAPPRIGKKPAMTRGGFSILEAIVASAILGIGLIGLVRLHSASMHGLVKAQDTNAASEVARQIAERFATLPPTAPELANCAPPPASPSGCRASYGTSGVLNPVKAGADCTRWVDGAAVTDVSSGGVGWPLPAATFGDGTPCPDNAVNCPGAYRVDISVGPHPDAASHPPPTRVVNIWVCWRDPGGLVNELSTVRMIPGDL